MRLGAASSFFGSDAPRTAAFPRGDVLVRWLGGSLPRQDQQLVSKEETRQHPAQMVPERRRAELRTCGGRGGA